MFSAYKPNEGLVPLSTKNHNKEGCRTEHDSLSNAVVVRIAYMSRMFVPIKISMRQMRINIKETIFSLSP